LLLFGRLIIIEDTFYRFDLSTAIGEDSAKFRCGWTRTHYLMKMPLFYSLARPTVFKVGIHVGCQKHRFKRVNLLVQVRLGVLFADWRAEMDKMLADGDIYKSIMDK